MARATPPDDLEAQLSACFTSLEPAAAARAPTIVALVFLKRASDEPRLRTPPGCRFSDVAQAPGAPLLVDALARIVAENSLLITIALDLTVDDTLLAAAMQKLAAIDLSPSRVPLPLLLDVCDRLLARDPTTPWRALLQTLHRLDGVSHSSPLEDTLLRQGPPPPQPSPPPPSLPRGCYARPISAARSARPRRLGRGLRRLRPRARSQDRGQGDAPREQRRSA